MWMLSSLVLFLGCPTPPEQAQQNKGNMNAGSQNGPQNSAPNNQGQPPANAGAPGDGGVGQGTPPAGAGNQTPPTDGPDVANTPDNQNNSQNQTTPEDGAADKSPVEVQGEPPPESAEPTPVTDSLLIRVERIPSKGSKAQFTQEQVKETEHVTFSGEATCDDCEGALLLRVVKFLGPNDNHSENNLITESTVNAGEYSISVPKDNTPVALELLVDKDGNGLPSAGEYFAVIEMAGALIPTADKKGLDLDSTKREFFAPAPVPGTQGPQ